MTLYDTLKSFAYNNLNSNLLINNNENTEFYSKSNDILNLTSSTNVGIINVINSNSIGSLEYNDNSNITLRTTCNIIQFENGYLNCDGIANKHINLKKFPTSTMNITIRSNLFDNTELEVVETINVAKRVFKYDTNQERINSDLFLSTGDLSKTIVQNATRTLNSTYLIDKSVSNIELNAHISFVSKEFFILGKGINIYTDARTITGASVYASHERGTVEYIELYKNLNIIPNSSNEYYFEFNQSRANIYTNEFIINIVSISPDIDSTVFILKHISISGESKFFEMQDSIDLKQKNILNCKSIDVDEIIMNGSICTNLSFNEKLVNEHTFANPFKSKILYVNTAYGFDYSDLNITKLNALDFQTIESSRIPYVNTDGTLITDSNYTISILSNIHELIHNGEPGIITTDGVNLTKYNNDSLYYFNNTNSNIQASSNIYTPNLQTDFIKLNGIDLSWDGAKLHYHNELIQNEVYDAYSIYPPPFNSQISSNFLIDNITYSYSNNIIINVSIILARLYNYEDDFDYDKSKMFFQSSENFIKGTNLINVGKFSEDNFIGTEQYIPSGYTKRKEDLYGFGITYILNRQIYPKYVLISTASFEVSPRKFKIYGTSNDISNLLYETNEFLNFKKNAKNYIQLTSNIEFNYNKFTLYVQSINGSELEGVCKINGFAILGDDLINSTTLSYKSKYNEFIINGKIGLNNRNPDAILTINNEPINSLKYIFNQNALVHFNLSESDQTIQSRAKQETKSILRMYRPCDNNNLFGNFVHHKIGAFGYTNSNIKTEYSIVLSENYNVELIRWSTPFRILSDNRTLINLKDLNIELLKEIQGIHIGNSVTIYDTQNSSYITMEENSSTSNYISIIASNLSDNQNIILPTTRINDTSSNYILTIKNIEGSNIHTEWQQVTLLSQNIILPDPLPTGESYRNRVLAIVEEPQINDMVIQTGWVPVDYKLLQDQFIFLGVPNVNITQFNKANISIIDQFLFQTNKIVIGQNTQKIQYSNVNENAITFQGNMKGYGQIILDCLENNHDFGTQITSNAFLTNGNIYTTGSIFAKTDITTDSDIRYKYNLSNIQNPSQIIKSLHGYTFNRNDTDLNQRFTGLIAQELQKVLPEAIYEKEDGKLRIFYGNLAGLFVEAFKDIYNELDLIKKKI